MDARGFFERKLEKSADFDERELAQKTFRPVGDSWFQKRLAHVRNELKKEMLIKLARMTRNH